MNFRAGVVTILRSGARRKENLAKERKSLSSFSKLLAKDYRIYTKTTNISNCQIKIHHFYFVKL
jgi:hypothetical protein